MSSTSDQLRATVAQGWTLMFMVFLANLVVDLIKITVNGDSSRWAQHLGMPGVKLLLVVMAVYALMPMLVRTFSASWFRFTVIGVTLFMGLFVGAHEISHLSGIDKPFGIFHALDLTHHVLVIWVTVVAVRWSRQDAPQGSSVAVAIETSPSA